MLGEAYGSGLPFGYLLLKATGDPTEGAKRQAIESFLEHFRDKWNLVVKVSLSDKDWSEIGACQEVFPDAKHQLCFWHCLRAVRKRLAILRRQPGPYNVVEAVAEFPFIDATFLPLGQQLISAPDISATQKPVRGIVIRGLAPVAVDEPQHDKGRKGEGGPSRENLPRIVLKIGGERVAVLDPGNQLNVKSQLEKARAAAMEPDGEVEGPGVEGDGNDGNGGNGDDDGNGDSDGDEDSGSDEGPAMRDDTGQGDTFWRRVQREVKACQQDIEDEDAPEWEFEDGETKSKDKDYTFCPAAHRTTILQKFTRHFVRHPIFPERLGSCQTAGQIREAAVKDMYYHCKRNGLSEVWAYLWTQWYAPSRWKLWARSTSPLLSRLRTTMTVENHWRQLKHQYLRFTHRPRLDHAIYVICTGIVPAYMVTAANLEDSHRIGRTKSLTPFRVAFKKNWKKKASAKVSGRKYNTSVPLWQCNCGAQETDPHHLCKHLVQAVPAPPAQFFAEVVRRRSTPLYRHPCLHTEDSPAGQYSRLEDGSITDGDDHEGIGGHAMLTKALRDENGVGGWAEVMSGVAKERLKRTRVAEGTGGDGPDDAPNRQRRRIEEGEEEREDEERAEVSDESKLKRHEASSKVLTAPIFPDALPEGFTNHLGRSTAASRRPLTLTGTPRKRHLDAKCTIRIEQPMGEQIGDASRRPAALQAQRSWYNLGTEPERTASK